MTAYEDASPPGTATLLPTGLEDLNPPRADQEAKATETLVRCAQDFGYDRVKPPLLEFESTLFNGLGEGLEAQSFRVMDPVSNHMLAVRPDMTVQVARMALEQLGKEQLATDARRPIRLCYAGQAIRVKADDLRPSRQVTQVGFEQVGFDEANAVKADAEVLRVALIGLDRLGLEGITVDITLPSLVRDLLALDDTLEADQSATILKACDEHDWGVLKSLDQPVFAQLMEAIGDAASSIQRLSALDLPQACQKQVSDLRAFLALVDSFKLNCQLRVDPIEQRGTAYHQGVGITLYAENVRGELARGGRYRVGDAFATGVTFYLDSLLQVAPQPAERQEQTVALDTSEAELKALHEKGVRTVFAG